MRELNLVESLVVEVVVSEWMTLLSHLLDEVGLTLLEHRKEEEIVVLLVVSENNQGSSTIQYLIMLKCH